MTGFGGQCSGEELTEQLSYQSGAEGYCMHALTTSYIHNVKRNSLCYSLKTTFADHGSNCIQKNSLIYIIQIQFLWSSCSSCIYLIIIKELACTQIMTQPNPFIYFF